MAAEHLNLGPPDVDCLDQLKATIQQQYDLLYWQKNRLNLLEVMGRDYRLKALVVKDLEQLRSKVEEVSQLVYHLTADYNKLIHAIYAGPTR